jgi:predicted PurR-regulated permease PerM
MIEPTPATPLIPEGDSFRHKLTVATFALLFVVLAIHLLEKFKDILQPLLMAVLVAYILLPVHNWLVRRGVRSGLAFALILTVLLALFIGVGYAVYGSAASITDARVAEYRARLEGWVEWGMKLFGQSGQGASVRERFRQMIEKSNVMDQLIAVARSAADRIFSFLTFTLIVFVYLLFLVAEKITFPRRLGLAFGDQKATDLLVVVLHINESIAQYLAVKAWISFVTGLLSFAVLASFGVEFAVVWGMLIFLFNFIPYVGCLVAVTPAVLLAFIQFDDVWRGFAVTGLLIGVQLFTGQYMEPRLAGKRLNLSPLLILLALAFWGYLWGVPGMILAVPLTVVCKIILDNIPETKPVGTLMSNV